MLYSSASRTLMALALIAVSASCTGLPGGTDAKKPRAASSAKPGSLSAARQAAVKEKLLNVAKVTFTGTQVGLISNNGGTNSAFQTAGVISNNGGNVVSGGAAIISNNGGGLRQFRAPGRRVAAVAVKKTIDAAIAPGEIEGRYVRWPNGVAMKRYEDGNGGYREISFDPSGRALGETHATTLAKWPDGLLKETVTVETLLNERGEFASFRVFQDSYAATGALVRTDFEQALVEDSVSRLRMEATELFIDSALGEGRFDFIYHNLKLREKGQITDVAVDEQNRIHVVLADPLSTYGGTSTVETLDGKLVYRRTQVIEPVPPTDQGTQPPIIRREYDLLNNLTLVLRYDAGQNAFVGELRDKGAVVGQVVMSQQPSGAVSFRVVLDDAPQAPFTIAYSGETADAAPSPSPAAPGAPSGALWFVATAAGSGKADWLDGRNIGAQAFNSPFAVAFTRSSEVPGDFSCELVVADQKNHRVRRVQVDDGTSLVETLAGDGQAGYRDGAGAQARFNEPVGVAVGPDGTVYVAEGQGHRIRKIAKDGTVSTLAGDGTKGLAEGRGTAARFAHPAALALDAAGNLYVADGGNARIRKITATGDVTTFAGSTPGFREGAGQAAQFGDVTGLAMAGDGRLFVADPQNARIRQVSPAGVVSTYAGRGLQATRDGSLADATFFAPVGLTVDRAGNLFVADAGSHRIRMVTAAGEVYTIGGSGSIGTTDGPMHEALFNGPWGLAVDPRGQLLFVTDRGNHRVRAVINDKLFMK